ncbi:CrcB family protein, partial [Ralstonia pseudosolanacearum]
MSGMGFVAVGVGAALGAWLRWAFAVLWNAINPALPYGTLAANLLGGYLIGVAVGFFDTHASLPPEWRLLAGRSQESSATFSQSSDFQFLGHCFLGCIPAKGLTRPAVEQFGDVV